MPEESSRGKESDEDTDNESGLVTDSEELGAEGWPKSSVKVFGSADSAIYKATITGDINGLRASLDDPECSLLKQVSPQKNTILHIAASRGHDHLVGPIHGRCPYHFNSKNSTGDLPLHLAASSGHLSTVKCLISNIGTGFASSTCRNSMLIEKENKQVLCRLNKEEKSPLYMAVEAGYLDLVKGMMKYLSVSDDLDQMMTGKSILHAAIKTRNKEVLELLLSYRLRVMALVVENGMTPLSYAASIGYFDGVRYILNSEEFSFCTYIRDPNGLSPIHMASKKGHINIIQQFLLRCPDSTELLDRRGQNILHIAAMNGKANVISHMLKVPELENLINGRDKKGNTPLHMATAKVHPQVVSILTWDKRVGLELVTKRGMTALDIAENYKGSVPSFQQRLTWQTLRYANVPRTPRSTSQSLKKQSTRTQLTRQRSRSPAITQSLRNQSSVENYKDRVNTLLLVAILVVTVTFAAGFTMPGGYNGSDPNKGLATMFEKHTFHVFLISNTIAMYSSMVVAVVLIWAQLSDVNLIIASLKLALPLLGIALTMVSSTFMTGVYLVVNKLTWLANFILIIGLVFLLIVLVLFVPLFLPSSLNHKMLRYIFYYPFYLLILVTQNNDDDNSTL
ncbi:hypothetical protein F0562_010849 [Nyssa sinensis]|uniref:PGG domain-containing protein n=1 Tax=Nyssa sinensis TaxID=561372 RepID=A0A5J5A545_9ASTE|nr:hypothetical protein F0562_010849 [Nyssa sinensis]